MNLTKSNYILLQIKFKKLSLNTQHDGDNNNCNPNEYIMAAVDKGFNPNSLLFSSCSIQQIKNYLLINNQ
jgi:hypothetical protein